MTDETISLSLTPDLPQKKSKKPALIAIAVILVLAIAAVVAVTVVIPASNYSKAQEAFLKGDYTAAKEGFLALGKYKDAADKAVLAEKAGHYTAGSNAFSVGDYETAMEEFALAGDYEDASVKVQDSISKYKETHYSFGCELLAAGDYINAAAEFIIAEDYSDARAKVLEAGKGQLHAGDYNGAIGIFSQTTDPQTAVYISYANGMLKFNEGSYTDAQAFFVESSGIEDADNMVSVCKFMEAESYMAKGYLNTAKGIYEELDTAFTYNDISVSDRLAQLKKHKAFVALCGQWQSNEMDASVRQTHDSTGLWDQWDGDGWSYVLDVTCVINDDNTVTMTAKANFWMYTNYSTLSKNLKNTNTSTTFTYTGKKVPKKIKQSSDFLYDITETLTINASKKTFELNYKLKDANSSMNFTYTYKSFGKYDTLIKAY